MVKRFFKKHADTIGMYAGIIAVFATLIFGFGGVIAAEASTPVTTEEYKVLTVYQYSAPVTNGYGGVRRHETKYHVTYINHNGTICEKEMHNAAKSSTSPYEAVYMSDETKFVVTTKGSTNWFALYLTEADFQNMRYRILETE